MNFKEILELIDKVADRGIGAVEIERAGLKLRIEGKPSEGFSIPHALMEAPRPLVSQQHSLPAIATSSAPVQEEEDTDAALHIITAPIVGTFYRSPNPESGPFINIGDHVSKGSVLGIIEAMKLMNEIESDVEGEIVRIYPQNSQPVEYGEKLFAVRL